MSPHPTTKDIINRKQQREQLKQALTRARHRKKEDLRFDALEYYGVEGIGKSRMLDEAKSACRDEQLPFVVFDFGLKDWLEDPITKLKLRFQGHISAGLERDLSMSAVKGSLNAGNGDKQFVALLIEALGDTPLIIMLDGMEHCPEELFDWIGREFIRTFVEAPNTPGVLLFLAGRGPRVQASRWPLLLRNSAQSARLDPLGFTETEEHIRKLDTSGQYQGAARFIYDLSNGHPYSTEMLVHELSRMGVGAGALTERRKELAERLYEEVFRQRILADTPAWVQRFIEIASIPRRFSSAMLQRLLMDAPDLPAEISASTPIQWFMVRLSELLEPPHNLVYYAQDYYELEPTLRKLIHTALTILRPAETLRLHERAREYYREMGGKSASSLLEMLYHTTMITTLRGETADRETEPELKHILGGFDRERETDVRELFHFRGLLENDAELAELIGEPTVLRLKELIEQFLKGKHEEELASISILYSHPNEYTVSWYLVDDATLTAEKVYNDLKLDQGRWQADPNKIGRAAFTSYLPVRAQEFIKNRGNVPIQLITNAPETPWELLHDGHEFLCLSRPFSRKPQMYNQPKRPAPLSEGPLRALVIGNPTGDLPGAEEEARAVADKLRRANWQVDLVVGGDATLSNVSVLISTEAYALLHYAGHGFFDAANRLGGLPFVDGVLRADMFERISICPRFIFLSACKTGKVVTGSFSFRGEFMEGFATSALMGGALECLGPMWAIGDRTARDFALAVYEHLLRGETFGESVRQARLAVRDRSADFWAAWALYGIPTKTLESLLKEGRNGH
jgi:hypothetical protein